jgi:hypothetical protein
VRKYCRGPNDQESLGANCPIAALPATTEAAANEEGLFNSLLIIE